MVNFSVVFVYFHFVVWLSGLEASGLVTETTVEITDFTSFTAYYPSPPLDNIRVIVIVWRLRGNIIRTAACWIVWHSLHSQQHTYMSSSYRSNRSGLSHWDPYAHSCIIVTWWSGSCGIQAWSRRPTGLLQCIDTVDLVIWPVKIVPEMT